MGLWGVYMGHSSHPYLWLVSYFLQADSISSTEPSGARTFQMLMSRKDFLILLTCFLQTTSHFLDVNEIQNDSLRMEHFTYVCAMLKQCFDDEPLPPVPELLAIFGKVSCLVGRFGSLMGNGGHIAPYWACGRGILDQQPYIYALPPLINQSPMHYPSNLFSDLHQLFLPYGLWWRYNRCRTLPRTFRSRSFVQPWCSSGIWRTEGSHQLHPRRSNCRLHDGKTKLFLS